MAKYRGLIKYTAQVLTPALSPYEAYRIYDLEFPYVSDVPIGGEVQLYLNGYLKQDDDVVDHSEMSRSTAGDVEVLYFDEEIIDSITCLHVRKVRGDTISNPYEAYKALNSAAARGVVLTYYPDVDNFPDEFVSVVAKKRERPQRVGMNQLFNFSFNLVRLPSNTYPASIPAFV